MASSEHANTLVMQDSVIIGEAHSYAPTSEIRKSTFRKQSHGDSFLENFSVSSIQASLQIAQRRYRLMLFGFVEGILITLHSQE